MAGAGDHKVGDAYISIYPDADQILFAASGKTSAEIFDEEFNREIDKRFRKTIREHLKIELDRDVDHDSIQRAAVSFSQTFAQGIQSSFRPLLKAVPGQFAEVMATPLGPALVAIGTPIVMVAGVTLGAALGGAIVAGLGTVELAGGIMVAFQDPAIKAAAKDLGQGIFQDMFAGSGNFRLQLVSVIDDLKNAFSKIDFAQIFNFLTPMVHSLGDSLVSIVPTLETIAEKIGFVARPLADAFGSFIENIAPAFERFIDKLAGSLPGLQSAFIFMGNIIISVLDFAGDALAKFGREFQGIVQAVAGGLDALAVGVHYLELMGIASDGTSQSMHDAADNMRGTLDVSRGLGTSFAQAAQSFDLATASAKGLNDELTNLKSGLDALRGPAVSLTEAQEGWAKSLADVNAQIHANTEGVNINTNAGRENRDAIEQAATASRDLAAADIVQGMSVAEATKRHQERIQTLIEEAVRNGANRDEVTKLVREYGTIPTDINTVLTLSGKAAVDQALADLKAKQISLQDAKDIKEAKQSSHLAGFSSGGLVNGSGTPTSDDNVIAVSNREYVVQAAAVDRLGVKFMDDLNNGNVMPGYAAGGLVRGPGQGPGMSWPFTVDVSQTKVDKDWAERVKAGLGGPAGSGGGPLGGWAGMQAWITSKVPGTSVSSGYRPGSMVNGHYDYHSMGRAIDIVPAPGAIANQVVNAIRSNYHDQTLELIHTPAGASQIWNGKDYVFSGADLLAGHYNHVHWAMDEGGALGDGDHMMSNLTGKPEAVLNPQHSSFVGRVLAGENLVIENYLYIDGEPVRVIAKQVVSDNNSDLVSAMNSGRRAS